MKLKLNSFGFSASPAEFFRTGQINNHRRATPVLSQVETTSGRDLRIKSNENGWT
jgi:hypothetical protein